MDKIKKILLPEIVYLIDILGYDMYEAYVIFDDYKGNLEEFLSKEQYKEMTEYINKNNMTKTYKKIIGYCPVDSGQIILVDPCYLKEWKAGEFEPDGEADNDYHRACKTSCGDEQAGQTFNDSAVVASTGYGDGSYPVTATFTDTSWGVRIKKIEIKFF